MSETIDSTEDVPLRQRLAENPRPAAIWLAIGAILILPQMASVLQGIVEILTVVVRLIPGDIGMSVLAPADTFTANLPTLLSRQVFPNQGYWTGDYFVKITVLGFTLPLRHFNGTFLGLEPMMAWAVRVGVVYAYAAALLGWVWNGYTRYRDYYRFADWTPRDDVVDRFRGHTWGKFGAFVVFVFVVMAIFSPTLGPTTVQENILRPYSHEIQHYNEETGEVETTVVGVANIQSSSQGTEDQNVGIWQYDDFGRFHPFGTTPNGKDMFTFMAEGARVSLSIAVSAIAIAGFLALSLSMLSAYYKGLADLLVVVTSDSIQALPVIMVLILMMVVFQGTWLAEFYDGALLMVVIFVITSWPLLWRSIRGPALQVSEEEWIDAAKSFGQAPRVIMQRHMAPYVIGYLLVYTSMSLGGIIISIAGLSFLGLGINPPTPEWGRIVSDGQQYVATWSWHISLVPGVMITLLVTGFNALGDGIRDAIDPKSEGGTEGGEAAAAGGGA